MNIILYKPSEEEKILITHLADQNLQISLATTQSDLFEFSKIPVIILMSIDTFRILELKNPKLLYCLQIIAYAPLKKLCLQDTFFCKDLLVYPFSKEELLLRSNRLHSFTISFKAIKDLLYYSQSELLCRNNKLPITYQEYQLLRILHINKTDLIPKQILIDLFTFESSYSGRGVDMIVSHLRKKLKKVLEISINPIPAIKAQGYYLID